mmetsp:Transcript_57196/g.147546  ORF Transcript_57196/g.147546 Transcript_57196/m.147546 type:complete len:308 (-) Transcript_57196:553-1476(-)
MSTYSAASPSPESPMRTKRRQGNCANILSIERRLCSARRGPFSGRRCRGAPGKPFSRRKTRRGSSSSGGLLDTNSKLKLGTCSAQPVKRSAMPCTARNSSKKVLRTIWSFPRKTSVTFTVSSMSEMTPKPSALTRRMDAKATRGELSGTTASSSSSWMLSTKAGRLDRTSICSTGSAVPPARDKAAWTCAAGSRTSALSRPRPSVSSGKSRQSSPPSGPPKRTSSWRFSSPPRKTMLRKIKRPRSSYRFWASSSTSLMPCLISIRSFWQSMSRMLCRSLFLRKSQAFNGTTHSSPLFQALASCTTMP